MRIGQILMYAERITLVAQRNFQIHNDVRVFKHEILAHKLYHPSHPILHTPILNIISYYSLNTL